MKKSEMFDKLDHDLTATIRNFKVAEKLFLGESADAPLATELLKASIEQLEELKRDLLKSIDQVKDWKNKPSVNAQK